MKIEVQSYSGHRADERPVRFTLGGRNYEVVDVEDCWYSPGTNYFRVIAGDGNRYVLRHDAITEEWSLEGFRAERSTREQAAAPEEKE